MSTTTATGTRSYPDHCQETFRDALTWTRDRRDREIRGYYEQLRELYDNTRPELTDTIIREIRAVRAADRAVA